jgi:hypothetical protein
VGLTVSFSFTRRLLVVGAAAALLVLLLPGSARSAAPTCTDATHNIVNDGSALALDGNNACSDPDGDTLGYEVTRWPTGTLTGDSSGMASYTPRPGFTGTDSFDFRAIDSGGSPSNVATTYINVTAPPGAGGFPPECPAANVFVESGGSAPLNGSCVDPEGLPLSYGLPGLPFSGGVFHTPHGTLAPTGPGMVTYTNNGDAATSDGFSYTANDGLLTTTASVALSIVAPGTSLFVTAPQATPSDPYAAAIETTQPGTVGFATRTVTGTAPTGYTFLTQEFVIAAPDGTAADPLVIAFRVDASAVPLGQDHTSIQVFRNGTPVPACNGAGTAGPANPDPCVGRRETLADGDVEIVVLTSQASLWNLGIRTVAPEKKAGRGCGDRNHVHASEAGCTRPVK